MALSGRLLAEVAPALLIPRRNMKRPRAGDRRSGFSLIEMLVILVLAFVLVAIGTPILLSTVRQAKLRGIAQETVVLMRQARMDAVKHSAQAVVRIVPPVGATPGRVEAFADRNGDRLLSAGEPMLGTLPLPTGIRFEAPVGLLDEDSVDGFTGDPGGASLPRIAVFQGTGAIEDSGAYRLADAFQNYLEVRVEPAATARIETQKAREENNDWVFYAAGEGGEPWEWQ
jgi:type II secretory pathway pseudopilin PulG